MLLFFSRLFLREFSLAQLQNSKEIRGGVGRKTSGGERGLGYREDETGKVSQKCEWREITIHETLFE